MTLPLLINVWNGERYLGFAPSPYSECKTNIPSGRVLKTIFLGCWVFVDLFVVQYKVNIRSTKYGQFLQGGGCLPPKINYICSFSLSFWNLSLNSFHLLCASSFLARSEADPAFWFLLLMLPFRLSFDTSFLARLKAINFDSLCLESWVNNPRIFCIVVALVCYFVPRKVVEDLVRRRQDWEGASTQIGGWLFLQFQELSFSLPCFSFPLTNLCDIWHFL